VSDRPTLALIVAGGRGSRAGTGLPKQYRMLAGKSVLRRSIEAFLNHERVNAVQVVIHPDDRALYEATSAGLDLPPPVEGGATRQQSVAFGLESLTGDEAIVLIHDAARPFVSPVLIDRCLEAADAQAGSTPALPVTDSLRRGETFLTAEVDRIGLLRVQTPQCFPLGAIRALHRRLAERAFDDDAALAIAGGLEIRAVEGDEANFKLTTEQDFARAERFLAARMVSRVGLGFDVHAFAAGEALWLGGVEIPHDRGLKGHSDADVLLHAVTDALLGAIGEGDIGVHFPPSDPQWRGAPSSLFVEHARGLIAARGGRIDHVDATLICESPRLAPYRDGIRSCLADLLAVPLGRISIKATTTERLGFTGRGEGIAAQAVATVRMPEEE
jgi:2-C-methyl-D-erythritol 4-phosphate cytidylyltransferase/2-C-methyl-D-erythritol 2,4-cyclodiphosphate synthase